MKEVIIFSYTREFALLRQLAMHNVDNVGYRVLSNNNILSFIREKTGNLSSKKIIDNKEKTYLFSHYLQEDQSYFKGSNYEAAKSLSETIDSIRMLIVDDEEKEFKEKLTNNKIFKEKYEAIYHFYKKYKEHLKINNETDNIEDAREIIKQNLKVDLDVITIKGEDPPPLNTKLLENTFNSVKEIELRDLFKIEETKVDFKHLYKSKGYAHEVANVFKIIAENKLPLDTCTIVYTDYKNFYNPIKEYSKLLFFPTTFIDGVPSLEYNAYRMLYLITKLNDGLYGYDVLMGLLKDKSFNYDKLIKDVGVTEYIENFLEEIGDLKFSFNKELNEQIFSNYTISNTSHVEEIKKFKDIFNNGIIKLIEDYLVVDDSIITNNLISDLELYKRISEKDDFDFFKNLCTVLVNGSIAKEGTISVCSFSKVKENVRENMFFIGNDSDSFHISLAENSFISDDKLEEFNKELANTSINNAKRKIERYKEAIQFVFDLGSNVYVSYSEKDESSELKNHNCVSLLYDLQKQAEPNLTIKQFKERFISTNTYYGNNLRKEEKIIESFVDKTNTVIGEVKPIEKEEQIKGLLDIRYAPTQIEDNIKCRLYFLIKRILGVNDLEEYDVFAKFANPDFGAMFHEVMEYVNEGKSKNEVLKNAEEVFDKYCAKRNPVLHIELDKDKQDFLEIVENGYEYLENKERGIAEQKQEKDLDINGKILHIKGFPDLISGKEIIDYKAKKHITHKEEDYETCIQALIYALMNSERKISHVEYYYPFFNKAIKATYDEEKVIDKLNKFVNSIVNNDFKSADEALVDVKDRKKLKTICKYCNFKDICGRDE